jgi:hypothetical protein
MVASGVKLEMGGAGDVERGVDAGTGVLGGIGVFVGSAIVMTACDEPLSLEVGCSCWHASTQEFDMSAVREL